MSQIDDEARQFWQEISQKRNEYAVEIAATLKRVREFAAVLTESSLPVWNIFYALTEAGSQLEASYLANLLGKSSDTEFSSDIIATMSGENGIDWEKEFSVWDAVFKRLIPVIE